MLEIEIVDSNIIENGIEVFARAWKDGQQIGFGLDGKVDIERFKFLTSDTNSLLLVPDPLGEVELVVPDGEGGFFTERYREDPEEAMLRRLTKIISNTGKLDSNPTPETVGNTTTVIDASLTDSKYVARDGYVGTYNAICTLTDGDAVYNLASGQHNIIHDSIGGSSELYVRALDLQFDTSSIPDTDIILSCNVTMYAQTNTISTNGYTVYFLNNTANSNLSSTLATEDYNDFETNASNAIGSALISAFDVNANVTNHISSFDWINKTGISRLGMKSGNAMLEQLDGSASAPTSWNNIRISTSADTPYVTIEHSAPTDTVAITQTANPAGVNAVSNVATYSSVSIGTATSDRIVVVTVASEQTGVTPTSCTIDYGTGDTAMTAGTLASFGAQAAQTFRLAVPTGTTATIKVTFTGGSPIASRNKIAVYRVTGADSSAVTAGADTSTDMDATDPLTTGVNTIVTSGGFLAVVSGATDTDAKTWANATEDIDEDAGVFRFTTAFSTTAGTLVRTCTGAVDGEDGAMSWLNFIGGPLPPPSTFKPRVIFY